MNLPNSVKQTLIEQWTTLHENGIVPVLEYQVSENEYVVIDISIGYNSRALWFVIDFDIDLPVDVYFSADVKRISKGIYKLYADKYEINLDAYLQRIDQEILEGFLLPNDLYYSEDIQSNRNADND